MFKPVNRPVGLGFSGWRPAADRCRRWVGRFSGRVGQVGRVGRVPGLAGHPYRRPSKEHANAVKDEVMKLERAGAIKEIFYPEWLANTVVVKKKTGKWRVCVDFTDLNKACPKDPFPMPRIDWLVDAIVGHPWMSFLDAF